MTSRETTATSILTRYASNRNSTNHGIILQNQSRIGLTSFAPMATIKAIDGNSVHQIQSGQVIVDLNSAVKELVENSLDAGASSIEVRFKNQGLESIQVQDNGKGIAPEDYATVALKHHTSKLSSYEDLTSLVTFGFRGEAISSLCALSRFHLVTARAEDGAVGKALDFDSSGRLKGTSVVAAQKGTIVSVDDLFHNLPVRRKELEKNIKRNFTKVVSLLHSYACISVGVRFSVTNHMPNGKKQAVFSTKFNTTTRENIVNVFGAKTLIALISLDLHLEMEAGKGPSTQGARNWSAPATDRSREVRIQGHISKPVFGEGRQMPDRQMFFINSRPCGLPQVSKAVNEVYKSFNVSQSPFVFANLIMDPEAYDVNVSPDKRTIMLHDQTALLDSLKSALAGLFEQSDHTVPQNSLPNRKLPAYRPLNIKQSELAEQQGAGDEQVNDLENGEEEPEALSSAPSRIDSNRREDTTEGSRSLISAWAGRHSKTRPSDKPRQKTVITKDAVPANLVKASKLLTENDVETEDVFNDIASTLFQNGGFQPASEVEQAPEKLKTGARNGEDVQNTAVSHRSNLDLDSVTITAPNDASSQQPGYSPADPKIQQRVQDLNALVGRERVEGPEGISTLSRDDRIPVIGPGTVRAEPGPVQNAYDRMRGKRTPLRTAEITVGDITTTTVLGSNSTHKRRRIHEPTDSQAIAQFGANPLLARGLHRYAAPGSQMHMQVDDAEIPTIPRSTSADSEEDKDDGHESSDGEELPLINTEPELMIPAEGTQTSGALDEFMPVPVDDDEDDGEYLDEEEKKIREDEKIARMIHEAEEAAARPTEENLRRASKAFRRSGGNRKDAILRLLSTINVSASDIEKRVAALHGSCDIAISEPAADAFTDSRIDDSNAEAQLSLTVSKSDFERMHVIGQFNLGFVLAIRPAVAGGDHDEMFIIDQHAADEKYNYERLQRDATLQSQTLVRPLPLELTAIEEEVIFNYPTALKANGFEIETTPAVPSDDDAADFDETSRRSFRLRTLPISGAKTFDLSDLDELLHLLSEAPANGSEIPRPKKVQRILAMRACRSSIMVGKTLTHRQMSTVVRHMGEMEKPWNCPHGRPTMRHLVGLDGWRQWREGQEIDASGAVAERKTDWKDWVRSRK